MGWTLWVIKHMKKSITICFLLCSIIFLGWSQHNQTKKASKITQFLNEEMGSIQTCIDQLIEEQSKEVRLLNYRKLRKHFKRAEFLLAYYDPDFYLKYLNAPPLPKLEKNAPDLRILKPKGLQVIDEILFGEKIDNEELSYQLRQLKQNLIIWRKFYAQTADEAKEVNRAIQFQLLRIYTQGITGFDTPGSLMGIEDAQHSMEGMLSTLQFIQSQDIVPLQVQMKSSLQYLKTNLNFNEFDRLTFYISYWQPMYAQLISFNFKNGIRQQQGPIPYEVNLESTHLFDTSFFNTLAFIDFAPTEIRPSVMHLGKLLFNEPMLSSNGKMSCASCHNQNKGFADGLPKSLANDGISTLTRNAPGLQNTIYTKGFFYDLRAQKLSQQFEHVIFSTDEFNTTLLDILRKLNSSSYLAKFKVAFPMHQNNPINTYTFKTALSVYLSSLRGFDSEFDLFVRGESLKLNKKAKAGFNLFMGKAACATCHFPPTFSGLVPPYFDDSETEVLGVPYSDKYEKLDPDLGRYSKKRIKEQVDFYKHSFKTTTVRNTSSTAPYMHNGVFKGYATLLQFYNNGGGQGHGLKVPNQTLSRDSLHLNPSELKQLEFFMKALEQ